MAATVQIVLVLTLLIVIYDHMIDPLYVILLALFNDVTMAPISSDNALPSKNPDVPTIKYIIGMSLVFGLLSTLQTMVTHISITILLLYSLFTLCLLLYIYISFFVMYISYSFSLFALISHIDLLPFAQPVGRAH